MNRNILRDRIVRDGRHQRVGVEPSLETATDRSSAAGVETTHDALIDAVAEEIGGTVEAAVGLVIDRAQDAVLGILSGRSLVSGRARRWVDLSSVTRASSAHLPRASGQAATVSSRWAMRTGLSLLRKAHQRLASTEAQAGTRR